MFYLLITITTFIYFSSTHSIPITRHPTTTKQSACTPSNTQNNQETIGFGNCYNNIYYINIEVGTPKQTLGLQFDTGSNTLWVPTQLVSGTNTVFNTQLSSTFTNTSETGSVNVYFIAIIVCRWLRSIRNIWN